MSDHGHSIDEALYRLLYHRSYREAFLRGDLDRLNLTPETLEALATIDSRELTGMSDRIRREVHRGGVGAGGGLRRAYPKTFGALSELGRDLDEVIGAFLESESFLACRELPFSGAGITVEEGFYHFVLGEPSLLAEVPLGAQWLEHEFLRAVMSLLVVNDRPNFISRAPQIRHNGAVFHAVVDHPRSFVDALRGGPTSGDAPSLYLYAAAPRALIVGPTRPLVAALIELGTLRAIDELRATLAARFSVEPDGIPRLAGRLAAMGLLS